MNQYGVDLDKVNRKCLLVGIIMNIAAPVIYGVIVYLISKSGGPGNIAEDYVLMVYLLAGVSIISVLTAVFLRRRFFFNPMISSKEKFAEEFSQKAFQGAVIVSAFAESLAIYGLILFFLSGVVEIFLGFAAASILFFIYIRPKYSFLRESLKKQEEFAAQGNFCRPDSKFNFMGWS